MNKNTETEYMNEKESIFFDLDDYSLDELNDMFAELLETEGDSDRDVGFCMTMNTPEEKQDAAFGLIARLSTRRYEKKSHSAEQ